MDVEFRDSRVHSSSSKHHSTYLNPGNRVVVDNSEINDDASTYFTCPFCYVDTELSILCNHLQDEHCFDVNNGVCPICSLNLGKDVVEHFKMHHASSIKTRLRSQKSGFLSFYAHRSSLSSLSTKNGTINVNASALDPLISPFLCRIPYSASEINQSQDSFSCDFVSSTPKTESSKPSMLIPSEENEDSEELKQRAIFCQQLILSTIF